MSGTAIEDARSELERLRSDLARARHALTEAVDKSPGRSAAEVLDDVAEKEELEQSIVQKALWSLVKERWLELTDEHTLRTNAAP